MVKTDEKSTDIVASKVSKLQGKKKYIFLAVVIIIALVVVYFVVSVVNKNKQNADNTDGKPSAEAIEKSREQTVYVSPPKDVDKGDRQALIDKYYEAAMAAKKAGKADEAKDNATKFLGLVLDDPDSMKQDQSHVADMIKLTGKKAAVIKSE